MATAFCKYTTFFRESGQSFSNTFTLVKKRKNSYTIGNNIMKATYAKSCPVSSFPSARRLLLPKRSFLKALCLLAHVVGDGWQTVGKVKHVSLTLVFHLLLSLFLIEGGHI